VTTRHDEPLARTMLVAMTDQMYRDVEALAYADGRSHSGFIADVLAAHVYGCASKLEILRHKETASPSPGSGMCAEP